MEDVDEVISIMGQPEQYLDEDDEAEYQERQDAQTAGTTNRRTRRIYRDSDRSIIGGVCAGLSSHFGWDPLWLRIIAVLMLFSGVGILPYIILWILLPEAKTTAEKLEMRGEKVNTENIARSVSKRFDEFGNSIASIDTSFHKEQAKKGFSQLGEFFKSFIKVFGKLIGVIFVLTGIGLLIGMLLIIFGSDAFFHLGGHHDMPPITWEQANEIFFATGTSSDLLIISALLLIGAPMIALFTAGIRLLFNLQSRIRGLSITLVVLFATGIALAIYASSITARTFAEYGEVTERINFTQPVGDTLTLDILADVHFSNHIINHHRNHDELIKIGNDSIYMGDAFLDVRRGNSDDFEIEITYEAHGASQKKAIDRAESINYQWVQDGSAFRFAPFYSFAKTDKYRLQHVQVVVYVPEGKSIYLSERADRIIYDIRNTTDTRDARMVGKTWTMMSEGLTCMSCWDGYSGPYKARYDNNRIKAEGRYLNGLIDGRYLEYYRNGVLKTEMHYLSGKLHGPYTSWYENGQIESQGTYVSDKLDGVREKWFITGEKNSMEVYENGVLVEEQNF